MNDSVRVGYSTKYSVGDWLDLHELTAQQCEAVLARAGRPYFEPTVDAAHRARCELSGEMAWNLAADALLWSFPRAGALIAEVRDRTVRTFTGIRTPAGRPFTAAGRDSRPVVSLGYRGRAVDLITVAHEFGHAVQIMASAGSFVPPVSRELCAFSSELALLGLLSAEHPALHAAALAAWQSGNRTYLVQAGRALAAALKDPQATYRYDWNYPIARVLASECAGLPRRTRWAIFEHRIPLSGLVRFVTCARKTGPSCNGACLAIAAGDDTGRLIGRV